MPARAGQWIALTLLMVAALAVRIEGISDPPLDFHATRQYRSAMIARAYYYAITDGVPEWRREIATVNMRRQRVLEPPIMELLAAAGYTTIGAERLWLPRLLSSLFWVGGGAFLYLCARRLVAVEAALAAVAFYLFLPFAVTASRSFQPDSLMVTALLLTLLLIFRYHERPSLPRLASAASAAAVAIFIKPVCAFIIFTVFLALGVERNGMRRMLRERRVIIFIAAALLPAFLFRLLVAFFFPGALHGVVPALPASRPASIVLERLSRDGRTDRRGRTSGRGTAGTADAQGTGESVRCRSLRGVRSLRRRLHLSHPHPRLLSPAAHPNCRIGARRGC